MKTILRAAHVATMDGPVIEDGEIVVDGGRIVEVGRGVGAGHADAEAVDLGNAVVLPGLVNAHTHLELTVLGQLPPPASFVDWVMGLRARMGFPDSGDVVKFVRESVAAGVRQSLACGVTCVGDVTLNPELSRDVLCRSPLRGISFGEVLGMAGRAGQTEGRIAAAIDRTFERDGLRVGIEPHAPYSLDLTGFERCLAVARREGLPLATHLAETADEAEFLAEHTGEFRRLWDALGGWTEGVSRAAGGPIRALGARGLLEYPSLLAHVNYADDDELDLLARGRASVVYCPRTHAYFGHTRHRFVEMIGRGINVAIGTDSAASSPDLNLLEDLRLVHRVRPELSAETLFEMATARGARALGMADDLGRLAAGMRADFCVFDARGAAPLRSIVESDVVPREVWVGGARVRADEAV